MKVFVCVWAVSVFVGLIGSPRTVAAPEPGVLWAYNGVEVSNTDVRFYLDKNVHPEAQIAALERPNAIRQIFENIYILRKATEHAKTNGLVDSEYLAWVARDAVERAGTKHWVDRTAAEMFSDTEWEILAKEEYLAYPDRYAAGEQVDVDHILVSGDDRSFDELTVRVREIGERLAAGEDFEALAREVSEDPSVARNAGSLGFISKGATHPAFEEVAFGMAEPGDISKPVLTSFGVHFIRFNGRRLGGTKSFEQVAPAIIEQLKRTQTAKARERAFAPFRAELSESGVLASVDEDAMRAMILSLIESDSTDA